MARERLADLDESKEDERERKLKLQEKNRRAQQAFRWRQKSKIQELSDQVADLTSKNTNNASQIQDLLHTKATLEEALANQAAQLQRLTKEYITMRARSVSNMFLPSSTLQFDPSEDVVLKYPASAADGLAEHVLMPSSDIQQGTGMERIRELLQEQWMPELKDLNKEFDEVVEKKKANSHGSSRTKQARQEEANKALESIDERCKRIQVLYYECLVKIMRAQPVRARMLASNVLYNCNANLSSQEAKEKAEKVLDELDLSANEMEQTCRMYEKFLCNMALLRWQREKMMQQLNDAYKLRDEDWLAHVSNEQTSVKSFLSASAAIETTYIWLRKETELYCDLITSICLEIWRPTTFMRQMTSAAPGMVDFLALLEVLRSRQKPGEKVLEITAAYTQSAITPRTMTAIAEGQMDAVASLRASVAAEPSPRGLGGLALQGIGGAALSPHALAQAASGLPNHAQTLRAAEEAEELLRKAKTGGREFWSGDPNNPDDVLATLSGAAAKKPKLSHVSVSAAAANAAAAAALPKLERSQLLSLPPTATQTNGATTPTANTFAGAGAPAAPPGPTVPSALLSLSDPIPPIATSNTTSPMAAASASPMGCSGPALPPLPLNNLNKGGLADISWLTHSTLTPREQEFTDFLSGMLSNRGPLPSPGRVSTIDILRVRSNSQVGEIELIRAQESVQQQQQQQQGQGIQSTSADVLNPQTQQQPQPQLQVNSLHLSGTNSQIGRLAQESLLGNLASVLPQNDNQAGLPLVNNGQHGTNGVGNTNLSNLAASKVAAGHQKFRRTPEELAKSYQEFMGEPI